MKKRNNHNSGGLKMCLQTGEPSGTSFVAGKLFSSCQDVSEFEEFVVKRSHKCFLHKTLEKTYSEFFLDGEPSNTSSMVEKLFSNLQGF